MAQTEAVDDVGPPRPPVESGQEGEEDVGPVLPPAMKKRKVGHI